MLFIILLGVITKLVLVYADCHISSINRSHVGRANLTGAWYLIYHTPQKHDEDLECVVSTYVALTENLGMATTHVYVKSTKTRDRFVGTVVDWNTNGYYDLYYTEPNSDTNCAANESCSKNPHYAGIWSGRWQAFSDQEGRYLVLMNCRGKRDTPFIYVAFRTRNPEEELLDNVKKAFKQNGLDFNQLLKWETSNC